MSNRPITRILPLLLMVTITVTSRTFSQSPSPSNSLPDDLGQGWQASGAQKRVEEKEWKSDPLGEVLAEYGVTGIFRRVYLNGPKRLTANLFIFRQTAGAYGWSTFMRRAASRETSVDHYGKYAIQMQAVDIFEIPERESLRKAIAAQLEADDRQIPVLPAHLPGKDSGLISGSETYLVGPKALGRDPEFGERVRLIDFSGLPDVVTADYRQGDELRRLLMVEFHTPQAATEAHRLWEEELRGQSNQQGSTLAAQPRLVRRIGNYIVELTGTADKSGDEAILGQIRYEQKVFWSGRKVSDIPLEFRPLDPAVLREATKTGSIIVRSLIWVGVMMLMVFGIGLVVGGAFFYWRRFRQQQKGTEGLFSDGGESIVLNLHDKE
jgi:hypothetical protein